VLFPSTLQHLRRRFKVPPDLQQNGTFIAALVPWTLTPAQFSSLDIQSSLTKFKTPEFRHTTSRALQYLEFPHDLRVYMEQPQRTYCVWWSPGDGTTATPGLETNFLHSIMKSCRAKNVGHKSDVRVVFVHIGAVKTLHRLPALAERRSKRPEIHFYTYGTHVSVPREQWGVRAIYPLGELSRIHPRVLASSLSTRWHCDIHAQCFARESHRRGGTHPSNSRTSILGQLSSAYCGWNGCKIIMHRCRSIIRVQEVSSVFY